MTKTEKRAQRNTRILQRMYMQDKSREIDNKASQIGFASAEAHNSPNYRGPDPITIITAVDKALEHALKYKKGMKHSHAVKGIDVVF